MILLTECAKTAEAGVAFPHCDRAGSLTPRTASFITLSSSSASLLRVEEFFDFCLQRHPLITVRRERSPLKLPYLILDQEKHSHFRAFLEVLIRN